MGPQSLLPSMGTVVTMEDKAGLRLPKGRESRPVLPSQPAAGHRGSWNTHRGSWAQRVHGQNPRRLCNAPNCASSSHRFPILLLQPQPPPQGASTQSGTQEGEPSSLLLSHLKPSAQEGGMKTWGKQLTYVAEWWPRRGKTQEQLVQWPQHNVPKMPSLPCDSGTPWRTEGLSPSTPAPADKRRSGMVQEPGCGLVGN